MDDAISRDRSLQLDLAFHREVAQAGHNPLLVKLVDVTFEWIEPGRERAHTTIDGRRLSTEGHRDILAAIVRGNPEAAGQAMLRHIRSIGAVTRELVADESTR